MPSGFFAFLKLNIWKWGQAVFRLTCSGRFLGSTWATTLRREVSSVNWCIWRDAIVSSSVGSESVLAGLVKMHRQNVSRVTQLRRQKRDVSETLQSTAYSHKRVGKYFRHTRIRSLETFVSGVRRFRTLAVREKSTPSDTSNRQSGGIDTPTLSPS